MVKDLEMNEKKRKYKRPLPADRRGGEGRDWQMESKELGL